MKITKFMRFLLVAMAALMVFSLFACQGEPETETTTEEIENTTESSDDKKPEDSEKDTDDSESTPVGGDTESVPGEESSSEEESTSETETSKPECQHVEETVAGKAATCTEAGLTEGKKCSKCGEIIVAQEEIPATGHTIVGPFTYVSNPDGDEALLQGKCENCDETATKPASFQLSVEGIFGGEGVYTFQATADGSVLPLMGTEMLQFNPDHPNYPADGYTPVPDGSATGFGNLFGIAGWAGYVGSTLEDGAAYKIVDLEGNVLVEWTAVKGVLAEAGLNVTSAADPAITEFLAANYKDGATDGFRFYHIVDVRDHITVIGGKTVKVVFAFNATAAAEGATYIPFATLQINVSDCGHSAATEVAAKAPTCTEAGNDAYKACPTCGKFVLADGTLADAAPVIAATGHTEEVIPAVAPTCEETGLTEGKKCSVCDEILTAQTEVAALGHNKVDKAFTYPTTAEEGWEAHKYCEACGTAWSTEDEKLDAVPAIPVLKPETNYYFGAAELFNDIVIEGQGKFTKEMAADRSYVTFARDGEGGDGNIELFETSEDAPITAVSGKYLIMKYRTTSETGIAGWFNTEGGLDGKANKGITVINDGEWHILTLDLEVFLPDYVKPEEDGTYVLKWARFDVLDAVKAEGSFDIAYIAITDDVAEFTTAMFDGDDAYCDHNVSITKPVWNESAKAYDINCICGATSCTYLYKTEASLGINNKSMTATAMDGFVRYAAIEGSDRYYFPIMNNTTNVTGNYLVIRYRLVNNGQNSGIGQKFAATAPSANTSAAANGDQKAIITSGSMIGDGEWHYYVVYIDLANKDPNTQFIANEDGTYTWKYLRLTFGSPATTDGTSYIDIDYLMFADHYEQFDDIIYEDLYSENPPYQTNVDATNNSINGEAFTESTQKAGTLEFDLEGKTVNDPVAGFVLGGWLCTPGGVQSYKIRVTKVNGEAVAAPALVDWQAGRSRNDIYTAVGIGKGYFASCATNAGFDKLPINLAAYAGQKIDFEVVATTNFGEELTIIKVNNLTVAEFECPHSELNTVEAKAPTCTEAGYEAHKVCKTCSQVFSMEGEELDAPVAIPAAHTPETVAGKEATCTATGLTEGKKCSVCGEVLVAQEEIAKIAHTEEVVAGKAATCTEAGLTEGKKCSVCGETLVAQEEIEALGHTEETVAGKAATCTATGLTEGKKCSVCGETLVAQEEIAKLAHTEETVAGKAANCEETGLTEGKKCSVCGEVLVAQEVIPANDHKKVEHAYIAPTTAETGCEKYSSCENCDKLWNADGEEIDEIPTIAVIVPTTEVYLGAAELADKSLGGSTGAAPIVSADRTYTNFARTKVGNDGNIMLLQTNTDVTGNYLVFKYRTDNQPEIQIWANTLADGHDGGKASFYYQLTTGEGWHIAIIDLSVSLSKYVIADAEGNYTIQWARMDILDGEGDSGSGYIDIAYIGICDDPADIVGIMQEGDKDLCTHVVAKNPVYTNLGDNHSTECAVCGETMIFNHQATTAPVWNTETLVYSCSCICGKTFESNAIYVSEPYSAGAASSAKIEVMDGFVRYTKIGTSDPYIHVYANGTAITGQYAIIKYRASKAGLSYHNSFVGSAAGTHKNTASSGCDSNTSSTKSGSFAYDGENWQYVIIEAKSQCFVANDDGSYTFAFLRLGFGNLAVDDYLDVDEIIFVDNLYAAERYVYGEDAVCKHDSQKQEWNGETEILKTTCTSCGEVLSEGACPHNSTSAYTWDAEAKLYKGTCSVCGEEFTKNMLYKAEGTTAVGDVESSGNFLTATQQDGGIIRYTPTKAASDPFFYPYRKGTAVTGQYIVIKYRLINNGTNMSAGAPFAASLASGQTGAAAGASAQNYILDKTLYADGEWHYLIVTPNLETNTNFKANADGTYSWAYLRIAISGFAAFDGSCYLEIDEIAFADNEEAAFNYMGDTYVPMYTGHTQSIKADDTSIADPGNKDNGPMVADIAAEATSIHFDAWVCTPGGVDSYKVRVITVDGEAVENPALVDWYDGHDRSDIYTGVGAGRGFSGSCAIGAGCTGTIDLSAYAGKKVDVEVVGITNYGAEEIIVARFTNVTVPAAQAE